MSDDHIEEKKVYIYKGIEYADYASASVERDKDTFQKIKNLDLNKEVTIRARRFDRMMDGYDWTPSGATTSHIRGRLEGTFPVFLIFKEKHGDRHFLVNSKEDVEKISLKILKERIEYWYSDIDKAIAEAIIEKENGKAAYYFLEERSNGQYEDMRLSTFENYS